MIQLSTTSGFPAAALTQAVLQEFRTQHVAALGGHDFPREKAGNDFRELLVLAPNRTVRTNTLGLR
jgi:hypothetical protein